MVHCLLLSASGCPAARSGLLTSRELYRHLPALLLSRLHRTVREYKSGYHLLTRYCKPLCLTLVRNPSWGERQGRRLPESGWENGARAPVSAGQNLSSLCPGLGGLGQVPSPEPQFLPVGIVVAPSQGPRVMRRKGLQQVRTCAVDVKIMVQLDLEAAFPESLAGLCPSAFQS